MEGGTGMMITGKARLAGVLGWPVSHSQSPRLHGFWLEQYGVDGAYLPLPVAPEHFAAAVRSLVDLGFRGANVTVPHKEAAFRLCQEQGNTLTDRARHVGSVNTLVFTAEGHILGDTTDGFGFIENLRAGAPLWQADAGPALILGAGGAARSVIAALQDAGCPEILLTNRSRARAEALAADLGGAIRVIDWEKRDDACGGVSLLVNTTSLGMTGQPALESDLSALPQSAVVTDIVYAPLETALLAQARQRGNPVVDGLGMLLHQARPGFEAWFGIAPTVTEALRTHIIAGQK